VRNLPCRRSIAVVHVIETGVCTHLAPLSHSNTWRRAVFQKIACVHSSTGMAWEDEKGPGAKLVELVGETDQ
jgi:hypothetical protein